MPGEALVLAFLVPSVLVSSWLAGRRLGRGAWSGLDALLVLVLMVASSSLVASIVVVLRGGVAGAAPGMDVSILGTALGGLLSVACVLLRADAGALGLQWPHGARRWWAAAVWSAVGFFGLSLAWGGLLERLGIVAEQKLATHVVSSGLSADVLLVVGYGVLVAPVVEEILFRGFVLAPLVQRLGRLGGAVASAVLFGLMHLSDPQAVPPLVVMGVLLAWLRLGSGSLGPPLALHMLNNAAALGALLLVE